MTPNAACSPIFVVGLPRSGSTLLSRLLNETSDIVCVNDLYFVQAVEADGCFSGLLTPRQVNTLAETLLHVIATRSDTNREFIGQFRLDSTQREKILAEIIGLGATGTLTWSSLMQGIMGRVAASVGKTRWADKTPQNFLHVERLCQAFPTARFIYLLRDPRAVLLSYKYASGEGHDLRRYHPLAYALYWRMAVARYHELQATYGASMLLLRYEDLTGQQEATCRRLGDFLATTITAPPMETLGHNSSFATKGRSALTDTETWICEKVCRTAMEQLGYAPSMAHPRLRDLPELIGLSLRFAFFQLRRTLGDRDGRARIMNVLRRLVKGQPSPVPSS